jgi:CRISPR/Cas system-associated exonuclease Cas4 (RecB family)
MRTIRVSEIGAYLYCSRSWWYQQQGIESTNQAELASGIKLHQKHGRVVMASGCLKTAAYALLILALALFTISAVSSVLAQ